MIQKGSLSFNAARTRLLTLLTALMSSLFQQSVETDMSDDTDNIEAQALPNWVLDESLEFVTVTFPTNSLTAIELQAPEVEKMLASIGNYRSVMEPEVAADYAPNQHASNISNPRWHTEVDRVSGEISLQFRDPRFSWLHYVNPKAEAKKLAEQLRSLASTTPQQE